MVTADFGRSERFCHSYVSVAYDTEVIDVWLEGSEDVPHNRLDLRIQIVEDFAQVVVLVLQRGLEGPPDLSHSGFSEE